MLAKAGPNGDLIFAVKQKERFVGPLANYENRTHCHCISCQHKYQ